MQNKIDNNQFDGQRDSEILTALFRKSILSLLVIMVRNIFIAFISISTAMNYLHQQFVLIGYVIAFVAMIQILYKLITWYYTFCLITNQRIRYTQRFGFFRQSVLDLDINSIEMVRYETTGFISEIFKRGDLIIDSSAGELKIANVGSIHEIYNLLQDVINKGKKQTNEANN